MAKESDLTVLGLVVNPKLRTPLVVTTDGDYVSIRRLNEEGWPRVGTGYYGEESDRASEITGMPRTHTPDGVKPKGMGYGTSLYTALCLGAHQNAEYHSGNRSRFKISAYGPQGDGVSSEPGNRSSEAEQWWDRAKEVGLVKEMEDEQTEEGVDVTSEYRSQIEGETYDGGTINYVNDINVDITKSEVADAYPWSRALSHSLVVADFTAALSGRALESLWKIVQGDAELEVEVEPKWLLALDVRGLTLEAINLLGILGQVAELSEEQLHGLRYRWELGLDPEAEIRQITLPFKKNSSEARAVHEAIAETKYLRDQTGWDKLEGLDG